MNIVLSSSRIGVSAKEAGGRAPFCQPEDPRFLARNRSLERGQGQQFQLEQSSQLILVDRQGTMSTGHFQLVEHLLCDLEL
jgi:hypothetical protein